MGPVDSDGKTLNIRPCYSADCLQFYVLIKSQIALGTCNAPSVVL